jgi:hypothetical protein
LALIQIKAIAFGMEQYDDVILGQVRRAAVGDRVQVRSGRRTENAIPRANGADATG